jgi:hypothetical protein
MPPVMVGRAMQRRAAREYAVDRCVLARSVGGYLRVHEEEGVSRGAIRTLQQSLGTYQVDGSSYERAGKIVRVSRIQHQKCFQSANVNSAVCNRELSCVVARAQPQTQNVVAPVARPRLRTVPPFWRPSRAIDYGQSCFVRHDRGWPNGTG